MFKNKYSIYCSVFVIHIKKCKYDGLVSTHSDLLKASIIVKGLTSS